jgi:uncharacterized protein GlcG (DUF336 family)
MVADENMSITLAEAKKIIEAARKRAEEMNAKMSFAVVDSSGHLVLVERMDGAAWITVDIAIAKAYTAVAFRLIGERFTDTGQIGAYFADTPSFLIALSISSHGKIIGRGGGVPIIKDGKIIGGLGISGGTSQQDHECCLAGLASLQL